MGSDTAQAQEGEDTADSPATRSTTLTLMMAALGIVYGDFGTSPLYTLQTVMAASGDKIEADGALGVLSLIVWSLIVTISIEYCLVVMETDNRAEGGILALMSLIGLNRSKGRWGVVAAGLFGASLIYGDGILTPAISVLSALEGINLVIASFKPYVMPAAAAAAILVGLFVLQTQGTATIGKLFGPVMLLWFIVIAGLGAFNLIQHPRALLGLNPHYGFLFLAEHGWASFPVLGACSWLSPGARRCMPTWVISAVSPSGCHGSRSCCLRCCSVMAARSASCWTAAPPKEIHSSGPCRAVPGWAVVPMVVLATFATIIASQAIITGAFSLTRQAMQMGWFPGLSIRQAGRRIWHSGVDHYARHDTAALPRDA